MRACAHMSLEVARPREALAAALVVAGVRPLARVHALVLVRREVTRMREVLATIFMGDKPYTCDHHLLGYLLDSWRLCA